MKRHEAETYLRSIERAAISLDDATALTTADNNVCEPGVYGWVEA